MTDDWQPLPHAEGLGGGFTCINRSKQSSLRAGHKGCVSKGEGETGGTFHSIAALIVDCQNPSIVQLVGEFG